MSRCRDSLSCHPPTPPSSPLPSHPGGPPLQLHHSRSPLPFNYFLSSPLPLYSPLSSPFRVAHQTDPSPPRPPHPAPTLAASAIQSRPVRVACGAACPTGSHWWTSGGCHYDWGGGPSGCHGVIITGRACQCQWAQTGLHSKRRAGGGGCDLSRRRCHARTKGSPT